MARKPNTTFFLMIIKKSLLKFKRFHCSIYRNTNKDEFLTFTILYCYCLCSKDSNYIQVLHDNYSTTYYYGFAVIFFRFMFNKHAGRI